MRDRRGVMLIVVLVVVIVTALVGVGALDAGRAIASSARTEAGRTTSRTIANAGLRAVAEQLLEQRDALLNGEDPELDEELELWGEGDGRAFARLLPVGPEGELWVSEAAKLDLNLADAETLAKLPLLSEGQARAIVDARPEAGYSSIGDLLTVDGLSHTLVLGDLIDTPWDRVDQGERLDALIDVLTVLGAEPNVVVGLGLAGEENAGQQRLNLNRSWNDEMRELVLERYDEDIARGVQFALESFDLTDDSTLCTVMDQVGADSGTVLGVFDAFSTSPDPYLIGRTDINRASLDVLACLPGLNEELAGAIVDRRSSLAEDASRSPYWVLTEEIITLADYAPTAPWVSARSLQWRVRLLTGIASSDDDGGEETIEHLRVTEVVIDLAAPRPRIAHLEDITQRPLLASFLRSTTPEAESMLALPDSAEIEPMPEEEQERTTARERRRAREDRERDTAAMPDDSISTPRPAAEGVDRRSGRWTVPQRSPSRQDPAS